MACNKVTSAILKNALTGRFFMPLTLVFLFVASTAQGADDKKCASTHYHERVEIKKVIDGDTVILSDDRHIRLVGIDTPEIFHDDRPHQPGAIRARKALKGLLADADYIGLRYDSERQDRHGRTLAHLFLPTGTNIQAKLLAAGLAMPLFIPPSVMYAECYADVAADARSASRGLWALPTYQPVKVSKLAGNERGFHIITGRVRYLSESRSALWINLENNVALRITRPDLPYFDDAKLQGLTGKQIEARGWLYERNSQLRMRLRFPLDLSIIK